MKNRFQNNTIVDSLRDANSSGKKRKRNTESVFSYSRKCGKEDKLVYANGEELENGTIVYCFENRRKEANGEAVIYKRSYERTQKNAEKGSLRGYKKEKSNYVYSDTNKAIPDETKIERISISKKIENGTGKIIVTRQAILDRKLIFADNLQPLTNEEKNAFMDRNNDDFSLNGRKVIRHKNFSDNFYQTNSHPVIQSQSEVIKEKELMEESIPVISSRKLTFSCSQEGVVNLVEDSAFNSFHEDDLEEDLQPTIEDFHLIHSQKFYKEAFRAAKPLTLFSPVSPRDMTKNKEEQILSPHDANEFVNSIFSLKSQQK